MGDIGPCIGLVGRRMGNLERGILMFGRKKYIRTYKVKLHLDGRHPYLEETTYDKKTQDLTVTVSAASWDEAERTALLIHDLPPYWRLSVKGIERA